MIKKSKMFSRIGGVLAILGRAEAFRCAIPAYSARNLLSKLGSSATAADTPYVTIQEENTKEKKGKFDWEKQWYPVLSLKHTDEGRAHPVQLLGKDLVMWRDKDGRWTCFDDRCPHRAAPLTEGRVEKDGTILCAYHAWRFDADGNCLSIPQSERGGRDEVQPKACVKVYPTQVVQDIIWIWGNNGPDAILESALSTPALPQAAPGRKVIPGAIIQRDLPYGWEIFIENLMDPSHVDSSHHGNGGSRYHAKPMPLEIVEGSMNEVEVGAENLEDRISQLVVYNIPTRPGWSRMIAYQVSIIPEGSSAKAQQTVQTAPGGLQPHQLPDWLQHIFGNKFVAQDLVFLHHQERTLSLSGIDNSNYDKALYMPTSADLGVLNLRKWIANFAGGGPAWVVGCDRTMPPKERNRDVLVNVYEQHTKNCTACLGALKRVKQLLMAAKACAVVSFAWAVLRAARVPDASTLAFARDVSKATVRAMLPGLAVTFVSLVGMKVLNTLQEGFYTSHYHHQDYD